MPLSGVDLLTAYASNFADYHEGTRYLSMGFVYVTHVFPIPVSLMFLASFVTPFLIFHVPPFLLLCFSFLPSFCPPLLPSFSFLDTELDRYFRAASQTTALIESREEPLLRSYDLAMQTWRSHLFGPLEKKIVAACMSEVCAVRRVRRSETFSCIATELARSSLSVSAAEAPSLFLDSLVLLLFP